MRELHVTTCTILLMQLSLPLAAQRDGWTRESAGDLELFTRMSAARRAELLSALGETAETLSRDLTPLAAGAPPVRILVEPGRADFARYRRFERMQGFFQSGRATDYLVLNEAGLEGLRVARHEMVHRHLMRSTAALPGWLDEGLAEFYSNLRRTGTDVEVGGEIPAHREALRRYEWIGAQELAKLDPVAGIPGGEERLGVFYAQSWALVHFLQAGLGDRRRFSLFLESLRGGNPPDVAFRESFGMTMEAALGKLRGYALRPAWPTRRVARVAAPAPRDSGPVGPEEIQELRAEIHWALGQLEEADPLLKELRDAGSSGQAKSAGQAGMLALRALDLERARREFERAISLDSRDPNVWFEYAMLLGERGGQQAEVERCLRRTIELAPGFAPAWAQLARTLDRNGDLGGAIASLERASSADPRGFAYLESLGELLARAGKGQEAVVVARRALAAARTEQQRQQVAGLLDSWEQAARRKESAQRRPAPEAAAPETARLEGELVRVDCPDDGLVFHFHAGGRTVLLSAQDPSRIQMAGGAAGRTFQCGEQKDRPRAEAEYRAGPASGGIAGTLLRLTIR